MMNQSMDKKFELTTACMATIDINWTPRVELKIAKTLT